MTTTRRHAAVLTSLAAAAAMWVSGAAAGTTVPPDDTAGAAGSTPDDDLTIGFRVLDAVKRPVSAVADQHEVREVATVEVSVDRTDTLTLLFDPEHSLDDRIALEQFTV